MPGKLRSEAAGAELSQNFRTYVFYLHFVLIRLPCASIPGQAQKNMARLREILLTQYIGAVMIGLVLAQAITAFVNAIVQSGAAYWAMEQSRSTLGTAPQFSWRNFIVSMVSVVLYVFISVALIRWLYAEPDTEADQEPMENGEAQL